MQAERGHAGLAQATKSTPKLHNRPQRVASPARPILATFPPNPTCFLNQKST